MDNTVLSQRQRWFRAFPDGSIEFLLVTRLLVVFLLLGLAAMRESQRPMVLMALAVVLMADYAIMIWWSLQTVADLDCLGERNQLLYNMDKLLVYVKNINAEIESIGI